MSVGHGNGREDDGNVVEITLADVLEGQWRRYTVGIGGVTVGDFYHDFWDGNHRFYMVSYFIYKPWGLRIGRESLNLDESRAGGWTRIVGLILGGSRYDEKESSIARRAWDKAVMDAGLSRSEPEPETDRTVIALPS